jgi:hypothetical protein
MARSLVRVFCEWIPGNPDPPWMFLGGLRERNLGNVGSCAILAPKRNNLFASVETFTFKHIQLLFLFFENA